MNIVLTNLPPDHSERVARTLIEERLAACVNWFPIRSAYRWKGQVTIDEEHSLFIKVASESVDILKKRIKELHPYELPEIVVLDVDAGRSLDAYVGWVRAESQPGQGDE